MAMEFDAIGVGRNLEVPGALPPLRATEADLLDVQAFPETSGLLREWVGATVTSSIEGISFPDGHPGRDDPNMRLVHVTTIGADGVTAMDVEYRTALPGRASRALATALGRIARKPTIQPRGWLSGRVIPGGLNGRAA